MAVLRRALGTLPLASRLASAGLCVYRQLFQPSYSVWQRLGHTLAEDPVVALPEFHGSFAIGARSHIFYRILRTGVYEPALAACALQQLVRGKDAIDVGANVGFFSVLLARHIGAGRVLSIEPTPQALARLRRNLALNGIPAEKVIIYEGVVSKKPGKASLTTIEDKEEYSTIGQLAHLSVADLPRAVREVDCATLDELVLKHDLVPSFVKIDAEGAEEWVIEGARETLAKHRPVVLLEVSRDLLRRNGCDPAQLERMLRDLGYTFRDPRTGKALASVGAIEETLLVPRSGTPGVDAPD